MSKFKVYHVLPYVNGTWQMKEEDASIVFSVRITRSEAIAQAKKLAHACMPSQIFVHKEDGSILAGHTYRSYPQCSM